MKNLFLLLALIAFAALSGCATTGNLSADTKTANTKILAAATKANRISDRVIKRAGPLVLTGVCIVQPQDCAAAKSVYSIALATHKEITVLIADLTEVNAAEQGLKLVTLYQKFQANIGAVNSLISSYGGTPLDMTEFNATLAEYQTVAAQAQAVQ